MRPVPGAEVQGTINSVTGVTITEVLVVVMILGILAGLALPQFNASRERAFAKEAKADLKRIAEAERGYLVENGQYYPGSGTITDIAVINRSLGLMLRKDAKRDWDYSINSTGIDDFTAYAKRRTGSYSGCEYSLPHTIEEPTPNVSCP